MSKILVTGAEGQLGHEILSYGNRCGHEMVGFGKKELDITNENMVNEKIIAQGYDLVVHCAAMTDVDFAQEHEEACYRVNVQGTSHVVKACEKEGIPIVYFSTDYVFSGEGNRCWKETDACFPINVYGKTKYQGEQIVAAYEQHYIIRISWIFGKYGNNFVKTMLSLASKNSEIQVVQDQKGSPTYAADVAWAVFQLLSSQDANYGIYHITNEGVCSWFEFAKEIFYQTNKEVNVSGIDSELYPMIAPRPLNSCLKKEKIHCLDIRMPSWQDALQRFLKEL